MPAGATPFPFGDCRVCNDKATGVHYGVSTCEGCKGFFKRSIPKADKYKCFFGGQCVLSPQNRNRCKACRFQRCLSVGMSIDAVKMGRIPKVDKERALAAVQQDAPQPNATRQSLSSFLPSYSQGLDIGPVFPINSTLLYGDMHSDPTNAHGRPGSEDSGISHGATSPDSDLQSLTSSENNLYDSGVADFDNGKSIYSGGSSSHGPNPIGMEPFTKQSPPIGRQAHGDAPGMSSDRPDSPPRSTPSTGFNSPFSPTIIKELITQVIESGQGHELQQTLLKQFFSGSNASRSTSSINSFMSSLEDWNARQKYSADMHASTGHAHSGIKTEMDCDRPHNLLSDLIGQIPPPPKPTQSQSWSSIGKSSIATSSHDNSYLSSSLPSGYMQNRSSSLDMDPDPLKLNASVPESQHHIALNKPRVSMSVPPLTSDLQGHIEDKGSEDRLQSQLSSSFNTGNPASHGKSLLDNGCHDNIQVDLNELDQYLCDDRNGGSLMNDLYHDELKNPMDLTSMFTYEAQQADCEARKHYLDTSCMLPCTCEEVLTTMAQLEGVGRTFIEEIQRNKQLMREEQAGDRLPHPINTVIRAKKHQVVFLWNQLMESIPICNINVLGLCHDVPQFCDLDPKIQAILMEEAYFDIWLTMNASLITNGDSYMRLPCTGRYSRWWMHYFLPKYLVDSMFHYAEELNKCHLTQTEIVTICAIQLTNPARSGLSQPQEVQRLHHLYLSVLSAQLLHSHPDNTQQVLSTVLELLPLLSPLNKAQADVVGKFKVDSPPDGVLKYADEEEVEGEEFD